jgi:Skp family chaperone for outer membrane proteins
VDIERALREAAVSMELEALEGADRRSLRMRLDALQQELAAEEADLVELRSATENGLAERDVFDARVAEFDQKVRAARSMARDSASAMESRYRTARETLRGEMGPILDALIVERGAMVVIDARSTLRAVAAVDATDALIERLDAVFPEGSASRLLPQPAPPRPRSVQP